MGWNYNRLTIKGRWYLFVTNPSITLIGIILGSVIGICAIIIAIQQSKHIEPKDKLQQTIQQKRDTTYEDTSHHRVYMKTSKK